MHLTFIKLVTLREEVLLQTDTVIQCNLIKIYDSSTSSRPTVHFHARKLLELCFPNELNPVAISVDLLDVMDEMQRNEAINFSILVIDQDFSSKVIKKYFTRHPSYLITADSMKILRKTLQEIKSSTIWNVASVIVMIGEDCDRAAEILQEVWKIEALNSFYVCPNKSSSESGAKQSICSSVIFDKTRSLDGYSLTGKENRVFKGKKISPEVFTDLSPSEQYVFIELFTALNVTPVIHTKNTATADLFVLTKLLAIGTYDMLLEYKKSVNGLRTA
ncbi:hypothetical protein KQX54_003031 [Cotesia glomerata]|uniref:Uncharacterized protein n=1 Tax=Cotesia glomerata TaxID=32391 RepID=A0AAV7IHU1_COTGL|nr:hypothetical protein KQX54_003031 [Cotesia glomerata]